MSFGSGSQVVDGIPDVDHAVVCALPRLEGSLAIVRGETTHMIEANEQRYEAGRKVRHLPSPHRLRDTFATAAHEARVHPLDLKILMNHALPAADDVTLGYIRPSIEHLRVACGGGVSGGADGD